MCLIEFGTRKIGKNFPVFIIAEAGINHNGDMRLAKEMIDCAADAGADAIKFQTFTAENIMIRNASSASHLTEGARDEEVYRFIDKMALSEDQHCELLNYCNEKGIIFFSTAGAPDGVDLLLRLNVPGFKIASMDLNNLPLLEKISATGKPAILSTGMGSISEIDDAVATFRQNDNNKLALLHCVALYPPDYTDVNLKVMDTLQQLYNVPVGYSDHTVGNAVCLAAVARGARIIEKHFTMNHALQGPDHKISADPAEFRNLVNDIRNIENALGNREKIVSDKEQEMARNFRRSIVSLVPVKAGEIITAEKVAFKRPGWGIAPSRINWVLGRKAKRDIAADSVISAEDLV